MSKSSNSLGLILFSSAVVLSLATNRGLLLGGIHTLRASESQKGDFIIRESPRFRSGDWRRIFSNDVEGEDMKCEIEICNDLGSTILFCWIADDGKLCHYYPINDGSIKDGSVSNIHVEITSVSHAFVGIRQTGFRPVFLKDVKDEDFFFLYRPMAGGFRHQIKLSKYRGFFGAEKIKSYWSLVPLEPPGALLDTSRKEYSSKVVCGFVVNYEPGVFTEAAGLEQALAEDLTQVCCLVPESALKKLQESTPFWINTRISYGPSKKPIVGTACTFHPRGGEDWLRSMGMREDKAGGIEMYSAQNFLSSRKLWGLGGLVLHELTHAYHNKHTPDGFDNSDVQEAYTVSMAKKLYDCVPVHGKQGENGPTKAYACANCMEFFAELSVAYLWAADDTEYNKWFPHNRKQLQAHDPETFAVLQALWEVDEISK